MDKKMKKTNDLNGIRDFSFKTNNLDDDEFCEYTIN